MYHAWLKTLPMVITTWRRSQLPTGVLLWCHTASTSSDLSLPLLSASPSLSLHIPSASPDLSISLPSASPAQVGHIESKVLKIIVWMVVLSLLSLSIQSRALGQEMVKSAFSVDLPASVNPIYKIFHRHAQRQDLSPSGFKDLLSSQSISTITYLSNSANTTWYVT